MENSQFNILTEYINSVKEKLPKVILENAAQVSNLFDEIRAHIIDCAEDLAANGPITEKHISQAINEFGKPENIAADFHKITLNSKENEEEVVEQKLNINYENSSAKESNQFQSVVSEALNHVRNQNKRALYKDIEWILKGNYNKTTAEQRYSAIGEIYLANPDYFKEKLYKKFQKIIKSSFNIDSFELEHFIIQKYSLIPGEKVLRAFQGKLQMNNHVIKGRIYITPNRLISHGIIDPSIHAIFIYKMPWASLVARDELIELQLGTGKNFTAKPCFGFQYSLKNAYKVKTKKNKVEFEIPYDFQKTDQIKRKKVKVKITIKEQDSNHVLQISNLLAQILNENQ
jgi:hypothetical protein